MAFTSGSPPKAPHPQFPVAIPTSSSSLSRDDISESLNRWCTDCPPNISSEFSLVSCNYRKVKVKSQKSKISCTRTASSDDAKPNINFTLRAWLKLVMQISFPNVEHHLKPHTHTHTNQDKSDRKFIPKDYHYKCHWSL